MITYEAKELIDEFEYYTQEEYAVYSYEAEDAKVLARHRLKAYIAKLEFSLGLVEVENAYTISSKADALLITLEIFIVETFFTDWGHAFRKDQRITGERPWQAERDDLEEYISYLEENSK